MKKRTCIICFLGLLLLSVVSCTSKKQSVNPPELLGDWYAVKGDVQVYSLSLDSAGGVYAGTLRDRPVVQGSWKADNKKLILTPEYEGEKSNSLSYDFIIKSDTLFLNGEEEVYTKTAPLYISHPEVEIFESLKWDAGLKFDQPVPAVLNWHDGSYQGYSITISSKLNSGDMSGIYDCLGLKGFESDSLMISEICNGYMADLAWGRIILTSCTSQDPEAKDDAISVTVTVAMKK